MKLNIEDDNSLQDNSITTSDNNNINNNILDTNDSSDSNDTTDSEKKFHKVNFVGGKPDYNITTLDYNGFKFNKMGEMRVFYYWNGIPLFMIGPDCKHTNTLHFILY